MRLIKIPSSEGVRGVLVWAGIFLAANIITVILVNIVVLLIGGLSGNR